MNIFRILILSTLFSSFIGISAQQSLINTFPDQDYAKAMELYGKQKYSAAQYFFNKVIAKQSTQHTLERANAEYYRAICALELFNPDAEVLLSSFIDKNPENFKVNEAYFNMGRHLFNNKKYSKATEWFEKVETAKLTSDQLPEYRFDAGYSYFMSNDYEKARLQFYEIKDIDTKYTPAALYYYSHIAYEQKNYETAVEGFLRLREDETFAPIVPYYITQIYFLQKKYQKVVDYAPPLLDSVIEKRVAEMSRMIGESYYKLDKYNDALPYLEKFASKTSSMNNEDRYQIAITYYKAGDLKNAIKYFEPVASGNNLIGQNALYHLADCYLKTDNKEKARLAFSSAANMDYDPDIKENSLFNYAIATYELSLSPFNEAVNSFNEYLRLYPYSKNADEAYNYLVLAYLSTKNYKAALQSIDKIKNKDNTIKKAYQRIAFYRGLELYNNLMFDDAIDMFDKSLEFADFDKLLATRALYWKGEANYRLKNYNDAIGYYNQFLNSFGAATLDEFELAYYNIGYGYFNEKNYDEAMSWFRKYTSLMKDKRLNTVADAYNRIGDCYFMKATYWTAIENYEKALALKVNDADYALFQKGFALGLVDRQEKKVTFLNQLLSDYPKSAYVDDALFELGRAYTILNNKTQAITSFNRLIKDFPGSSYVPKAHLQLGLIYFNSDRNQDAIAEYKKVIEEFPNTADARNATLGLKTVYVDMNDVDSYFSYMQKTGSTGDIRLSEQDSLTYVAAENVYMSGDCDKATQQFSRYIDKFQNGNFLVNANFYMADCNYRNNKQDDALKEFQYVLSAPHNMFTEQSLVAAGNIFMAKKEYGSALNIYKRLENEGEVKTNIVEAKIGQMRCNFYLSDYNAAIESANSLLASEKVQQEIVREAHYILSKSYLETQNSKAIDELKIVSADVKSDEGAECKYLLAKAYFDIDKKDLAEKEIFDFIKKNTPNHYWLGKSFLLLADIYIARKDEFQAVQTLQSLINNYETTDDGIIDEAKAKRAQVVANSPSQLEKKDSDIEINMNQQKLQ